MNAMLTESDTQLLEAYLDDALSATEVQSVDARLSEPEVAAALDVLRSERAARVAHRRHPILTSFISQVTPSESSVIRKVAMEPVYLHHLKTVMNVKGVTRVAMHEPYRTLLGHFRHETGHYFWDRLVRDRDRLDTCRALFGNDRQDYGQALQAYYANGAPADWQQRFVSTYAASHPWEDFAETWAHYLHIVDTLEIARAFGLSTHPELVRGDELDASVDFDPYRAAGMAQLIDSWLPLSLALNSLNRAMGQSDLYPFVLSQPAIAKLGFVNDLVHAT